MAFPIQDGEDIPEWLARIVYKGYVARYGSQQSFERIRERCGFGAVEVVYLLNSLGVKSWKDAIRLVKGSEGVLK